MKKQGAVASDFIFIPLVSGDLSVVIGLEAMRGDGGGSTFP